MEDSNNGFSISFNNELELVLRISTYKDIAESFFEKIIDDIINFDTSDEEEYNKLINLLKFDFYIGIGSSYLNLEVYNSGFTFDLFEAGSTDHFPNYGYNSIYMLEQAQFNIIQQIFQIYIFSFIDYAKLYLIGDLDNSLISSLSQIVKNKIKLNSNNFQNINNINIINDFNFIKYFNKNINFDIKRKEIKNNVGYLNAGILLNQLTDISSLNENAYNPKVVNYIYSNNNPYEKESYTALFYNIKMLNISYSLHFNIFFYSVVEKIFSELRTKKSLGYHALSAY